MMPLRSLVPPPPVLPLACGLVLGACAGDDAPDDDSTEVDPSQATDASGGDGEASVAADASAGEADACGPKNDCPDRTICAVIGATNELSGAPKQLIVGLYEQKPDFQTMVAFPDTSFDAIPMPTLPYRLELPLEPFLFNPPAGKRFVAVTVYASDELYVPLDGTDFYAVSEQRFDFDGDCARADLGELTLQKIPEFPD
jgi:hypothetical protein